MKPQDVYSFLGEVAGSDSDKTIYTDRVEAGSLLHIDTVAMQVYTTNFGDYTTAKYLAWGVERSGKQYLMQIKDISGTHGQGITRRTQITLRPGDRLFFKFEATSTSETYQVTVFGMYYES